MPQPHQDQTRERDQDLERVAITGMAGRFPGAPDVETFWTGLTQGREGISTFSDTELTAAGVEPEVLAQEGYVKAKGVLEDADRFDGGFFGYNPREAELLDPQHRVFLECAWHALESAGVDPARFEGRIGVFAGAGVNSYLLFNIMNNQQVRGAAGMYQVLLASGKDFLATRAAYKLGLKGPAVTVQTACSTSLTAVHLACQSLLNGECDIALAGGVSVSVPLRAGYRYEPGGILSPDGTCRAFDADAAGTVAGNGVGLVVLRRLADAADAGDAVDAVILASAANNDGSLKAGYTAPGVDGQAEVVTEALALADIDPETVGYVETHGTGTPLGDPIEIAALTRAFRASGAEGKGFCAIGSVKSNVGHLDAAAGVTGLIKAVLALKHQAIPPTLHCEQPNPALALDTSPFHIATELRAWPRGAVPRRAGVSSFGIGGTNVHVVLEEAPAELEAREAADALAAPGKPETPPAGEPPARLLPLSAASAPALTAAAGALADHLERRPGTSLRAVAHTLAARRAHFAHRTAAVARTTGEAVAALRQFATATPPGAVPDRAPVAFLFPGQGAQYPGMARGLHAREPVFADAFDQCAELFAPHLGEDLRDLVLLPPGARPEDQQAAAERLRATRIAQPALFSVEYALARLWRSWGVEPQAMAGHSVGEYTAACLAGVFGIEDAVRLVAARGRIVQQMPPGAMLSVFLTEEETAARLGDGLSLAAVNSTALTVVSGDADTIGELERELTADGVGCRRLHTSHAFHSPDMDAAVAPFTEEVRAVALRPPTVPFVSDVTGTWITGEQATSPDYWGSHLRRTVRFRDALDLLLADPALVALEVGPGQNLGNFARAHRAWTPGRTAVGSLPHPGDRTPDDVHLLASLGAVWAAGAEVDWTAVHATAGDAPGDRRPVRLPGYPFERRRYWVEPTAPQRTPEPQATPEEGWFHAPCWKRLTLPAAPAALERAGTGDTWVVLGAGLPLGDALAARLGAGGERVVRVAAGTGPSRSGDDGAWTLDPADREQLTALLSSLAPLPAGADADPGPSGAADAGPRLRLVHLWSTTGSATGTTGHGLPLTRTHLDAARRTGYDSLVALAQALAAAHPGIPVTLDVVSAGVYDVTGDEPLRPENALLLGAATVIPQETRHTTCRLLDVTGDAIGDAAASEDAIRSLLTALTAASAAAEPELALRGRHWWARGFDAVPLDGGGGAGRTGLRDGGVYLVTGGLGGLGLAMAEHIAAAVDRPVIGLLGRTAFPARDTWDARLAETRSQGTHDASAAGHPTADRIRRLRRMEEAGARIVLLQADVTDDEQAGRAVRELRAAAGGRALDGVVHAAGVPSRGMLVTRSADDADQVLAAKTHGLLSLERACRDDELDFLLLCSSVTAVLGGPGQSDYAAANAFLDAWAQAARRDTGLPVTSVGWDTWQDVGMAAGLDTRFGAGAGSAAAAGTAPAGGHPLLSRLVRSTPTSRTYATVLSTADSWIVGDHRIQGHGLVPGTAYLELVRAAVAEQAAGRDIEIGDVQYMVPVVVPDGRTREVFTTVEERGGKRHFAVQSRTAGGGRTDHARGTVAFHDPQADIVRDLPALIAGCDVTQVLDTEESISTGLRLDKFQKGGPIEFSFGPRWKCMHEIKVGARRLFATLRLGEEHHADLDHYLLHPALLDAAGGTARVHVPDTYYLPFSYRSLRVRHGLTSTIHAYVELKEPADSAGETSTCDIEILDPDGRLLVSIGDFTIKRINDLQGLRDLIARSAAAPREPAGQDTHSGPDAGPQTAPDPQSGESDGGARVLRALAEGITEEQGRRAFARILAAPGLPGHLVVSHREFTAVRELARSLTPDTLAQEMDAFAPAGGTHPRPDLPTPYVAPRTPGEQAVAEVWGEILGVARIGVDDDFFALGGHSLAAVQIGTRLKAKLGADLDLPAFFDHPTVAHTASLLAAAPAGGSTVDPDDVIEVQPRGEDTLDGLTEDDLSDLTDEEVEAQLRALLAGEGDPTS